MKINNIKFENFKCFKNIDLELGRITLLTGANSSGKSSVIYGILGALQSGEFPLQFSPNGKYVEMGDFQEMSYNHDKSNLIKISFDIFYKYKTALETFWEIDKVRKLPTLNSFTANTDFYTLKVKKGKTYKLEFEYFSDKDPLKDRITVVPNVFTRFLYKEESRDVKNKPKVEFEFKDLSEIEKFIYEKGGIALEGVWIELLNIFNHIDNEINYISSFRLQPNRTYYEQTKTDLKVGKL